MLRVSQGKVELTSSLGKSISGYSCSNAANSLSPVTETWPGAAAAAGAGAAEPVKAPRASSSPSSRSGKAEAPAS